MADTTISVPEDLADELYERKARGESYADVIYRLLDDVDAEADAPRPTSETSDVVTQPESDTHAATEGAQEDPDDLGTLVDHVADDVLPGSGPKLDARREAFHAVVDYLKENGTATPKAFRTDVYPDHSGRYTEGEDPAQSWWKNAMYPALGALAERTDDVEKADTTGTWRYTGEP